MTNFNEINETVRDNIDVILDKLEIESVNYKQRIGLPCPIHGGDNENGCSLFIGSKYATPTWKCFTNHCEDDYGKSLIGFIKGVLSEKSGKEVYTKEVLKWIYNALNIRGTYTNEVKPELNKFLQQMNTLYSSDFDHEVKVKREDVISRLEIPSKYFINRGYSKEILTKYDIGLCSQKGKEMSNRIVVPVYDDKMEWMVGCSGRSIFPECPICLLHHADYFPCPTTAIMKSYAQKWKHSYGFSSGNHLYNYWYAKEHILRTGSVILVEGPADVWRLEEAGFHNSVGIFGVSLSDRQKILLEMAGAMNLFLFFDPDKAGENVTDKVEKETSHMYNIVRVNSDKEPGDLNISQVKERLSLICK